MSHSSRAEPFDYIEDSHLRQRSNAERVWEIKSRRNCLQCGESHPACLDFHHRDPLTKFFTISQGMLNAWHDILREIEKCDLICANCHRKEHYHQKQLRLLAARKPKVPTEVVSAG